MSASAIRRKSYKRAQEEAGLFSPVHWEGDKGSNGDVPAGKLQVMEKFFTPVRQTKENKGASSSSSTDLGLRDCSSCHHQWAESRSGHFSTLSSSSASSTSASSSASSSASWSSEASLDKEAFLLTSSRYHPQHSQSCVDLSGEARAFRRGREEEMAEFEEEEAPGSFSRLRKGQSKSADRLGNRHGLQSQPGQPDGVDRHLYKAASLERSLAFSEQAEILAPRQPHYAGAPAPSKGILKNGAVAGGDWLRKAKSIETITVRSIGKEPLSAPGPARPLQREKQPPNSLDLSTPKKPPITERMKLVEEKLRFSEFLNEITQQVMSPSSLSSLGWKPPEPSLASKAPSTDGSDSKGSSSKGSSPGSLLEMAEAKAEAAARRRTGQAEAKVDALPSPHSRPQANLAFGRATDEASTSPELAPFAHLPAKLGSLPKLPGEAAKRPKKPSEAKGGHGQEAKRLEQPLKKAEKGLPAGGTAEKANPLDEHEGVAAKKRMHNSKELLAEAEQPVPSQEQEPASPAQKEEADAKPRTAQRDLQKTWDELDALKEKFSRLQEDYSNTRLTNQLLEDRLQIIAQSMAEEKQTLNQRINELLERLISAQNTICTLEKINISGLLAKPSLEKQRRSGKDESPSDSLCSLHILDVAPPPAFMDGASETQTTPNQSDSATETSKLGCSSESDTAAGPSEERSLLLKYEAALVAPSPEGPKRHSKSHSRATAYIPWKQKSTTFSTQDTNSTESECSGEEEAAPLCPLPAPRFLYLRQEALVAPPGPSSHFPALPTLQPEVFEAAHLPSPTNLPPSGKLEEMVPEMSSSESSEDGEVSWSPGLVEKTSGGPHLDYQSAQKMLDGLLQKSRRGNEPPKVARLEGFRLAGATEGNGAGRGLPHYHHQQQHQQHRIRYYQEFPSPEEGKSYPCPLGTKGAVVGPEGSDAAQDSTSL
ncbi:uncharacterized protein LOC114587059 [Podarcis muralis]